ncbi:MAG: hypothetical protein V4729_04615 [Pseudomonadota bacterium]
MMPGNAATPFSARLRRQMKKPKALHVFVLLLPPYPLAPNCIENLWRTDNC